MPTSTTTAHPTPSGPRATVLLGVATAAAGNTRLAYIHEGTTITKVQETHYYPFRMKISPLSNQPVNLGTDRNNAFLYNGKEFNDDFELKWYDYGARFYDAQIARFHSVDPWAEKYTFQSPYAYAANNPILFIDYMGLGPGRYFPLKPTFQAVKLLVKNAFSSNTPQNKPAPESTPSMTREERVREVMTNIENMPQSSIKSQGADIFKVGVSKGLKTKDGVPIADANLSFSLNEDKGPVINAGVEVADVFSESVSVFSNESGDTEVIRNFEPNNEGDIPIPGGTVNPSAMGRVITRTLEFMEDYLKTKADRTMNPQNYINNEER